MKKAIFTLLLLLCCLGLRAQEYVFEYDIDLFLDNDGYRYYSDLYYQTSQDRTEKKIPAFDMYQEMRSYIKIKGEHTSPAHLGPITKIRIKSHRQEWMIAWWNSETDRNNTQYENESGETEFSKTNVRFGIFDYRGSYSRTNVYRVYPRLLFKPGQPRLLPNKDKVLLENTSGFPSSVYKWQYSIDGGATWIPVPLPVINASPIGSLLVCGEDLMDANDYRQCADEGRSILFRVFNPVKSSEVIGIQAAFSTPHISSHQIMQERCHQSGDAAIRIQLDRALLPEERLSCFLNGVSTEERANIELDADHSFTLRGLRAGHYQLSFKASYKGYPSYVSAPTHKLEFDVQERPEITHTVTSKQVSCYQGSDGEIKLIASGGTGSFVAELSEAEKGLVERKSFSSGSCVFGRLPKGDYLLRVQDSNGCISRDSSGEELVHQISIVEPAAAVEIEELQKLSPLAHLSSDGAIQVAVSGGTPAPEGYQVSFVRKGDGQRFSPTEVLPDGDRYLYTLKNIPKGEYLVIVADQRFALLSPQDQAEPCGCRAELLVVLTAPPPLKVKVEEGHFVSCHGDSDGALRAIAEGGKPFTTERLLYEYSWFQLIDGERHLLPLAADSIARDLEAGLYLVEIRDSNGITLESQPFLLVQPEALSLDFEVQPPSCSGGEGRITAKVQGGTPPYRYEWNVEGATETELSVSEVGRYFLRVLDSRGCYITGSADVSVPSELSIKPILKHPSCYGASNGAIALEISGGTPPYVISWDDDSSLRTHSRDGLSAGSYLAIVQDQAGCQIPYRLLLEEPKPIEVYLEDSFTLCADEKRSLKASASEPNLNYRWFLDGRPLESSESSIVVSQAGRYRVVVSNAIGCTAQAEVEIKMSSTALPMDLTMPSTATVNQPIHVVNLSEVRADSVVWLYPESASLIERSDRELIFSMPKLGSYEVTMIGYLGDCSTVVTQKIEIVAGVDIVLPKEGDEVISQFLASPNPTTGVFEAYIELIEPRDCILRLLSPSSVEMDRKELRQLKKQRFSYELRGSVKGVYSLELQVGDRRSVLKITKENK